MKCAVCGKNVPCEASLQKAEVSHMACILEQVSKGKDLSKVKGYAEACAMREKQIA